jgi:hypothetical protein
LQRDEADNGVEKAELEERVMNATEEVDFFTQTIQEMNELIASAVSRRFSLTTLILIALVVGYLSNCVIFLFMFGF